MISAKRRKLVTLKGECFDLEYHGDILGTRDGVFHDFELYDAVKNRGMLRLAVTRGGARDFYTSTWAEYDRREDAVVLKVIRQAFDRGKVNFDASADASSRQEIALEPSDFKLQLPSTDNEIRRYIIHKAYWLAYQHPANPQAAGIWGSPISFDEPADLEYLEVAQSDIWKNIKRLENRGLLSHVLEGQAAPTELLLTQYEDESDLSAESEDRKFARLAIDQARKSIAEDDRVHPKVGAVVVKDGRVIASAFRGEIPECHAEYVALEKKLKDVSVVGATVYTTLEPCTSRKHPKVPCAARLAERKVARVVIGVLDPDDRISGRGQRSLRKAGIITDLFPFDLMSQVEDLNRDFIRDRELNHGDISGDFARTARTQQASTPVSIKSSSFGGTPGPILVSGRQHSVQGPWIILSCKVTIVNCTLGQVEIAPMRLLVDAKEWSAHKIFFRRAGKLNNFERVTLVGNQEDLELHFMFPDDHYPESLSGELLIHINENEPLSVPVMFP
jgi:pyrimidine deaminase RibD-like protein